MVLARARAFAILRMVESFTKVFWFVEMNFCFYNKSR